MITNNTDSFKSEVFSKLSEKRNLYDPLIIIEIVKTLQLQSTNLINREADGMIRFNYIRQELDMVIEIINRTAPQVVERGIAILEKMISSVEDGKYIPTLIVPYLSPAIIERLKEKKISGLDLNGNYYIATDNFIAVRLDNKNQYKESVNIKDIYSRNSSIVSKFLLGENTNYQKVSDIYEGIKKLGGKITLSTVSKVLTALQEQLIISKEKGEIRILQPAKLLSNLCTGYRSPVVAKILRVNLPQSRQDAKVILDKYFINNWIWSGESSAEFYATTTSSNQFTVYCRNIEIPQEFIQKYVDVRFYNYTFCVIPESEEYLLYDSKENIASKIQTYIELSQLDKREKEIAKDIERDILNEFSR
ncbi:MAG: hypothetical protein M0P71_18640 [Melioribacteraceae bacterium]|nr:hypothetical protein [Melioribacteraceae bacterium]